jgi:hypothetical protein
MSEIKPTVDEEGVPWCRTEPGAETHQCPSWRLQRCEAGGRPWGICSPAVRRMAKDLAFLREMAERLHKMAEGGQIGTLPCGHVPDVFRDHLAICSRCES